MDNQRQVEILMADDSPSDLAIAQEAIKSSRFLSRPHTVTNGEEVMAFLRREGRHTKAPIPDLILLDLNMPRKGGLEVLSEIKAHPQWKLIPVIVLTASQAERDVAAAYGHHANCYIAKPVDFDRFIEVVQLIENFWFNVARLPPKNILL